MKLKICIFLLALVSALAEAPDAAAAAPAADSVTLSASRVADLIIDEAYKHIGTPYRYGARGPKAFDCSGFTSYVYRQLGYELSRSSKDQARDGRAVEGTYADMQKGDIIIFGSRAARKVIGHVGIFIEMSPDGQDFTFIHAATHGGVTVSHITEEYYATRFLAARRVLPDFEPDLPEPEPVDIEEVYGDFFLPVLDTLQLAASDRRIVLFGDGTWAVQNSDGTLSAADAGSRIVLNPGGTWQPYTQRTSSVRVPSSATTSGTASSTSASSATASSTTSATKSAASTQPTTTSGATSTSASATSASSVPDPADAEYHIIRSGDTLDKISKTYHTTIDRLCELNGITRKTILHIGRRLRVR